MENNIIDCTSFVDAQKAGNSFASQITLPLIGDFNAFRQGEGDSACAILSILGAACQNNFRDEIEHFIQKQCEHYILFKFKSIVPSDFFKNQSDQNRFQERYKDLIFYSQKIFRVRKEIHRTELFPSIHPFVNTFLKAFCEYMFKVGIQKQAYGAYSPWIPLELEQQEKEITNPLFSKLLKENQGATREPFVYGVNLLLSKPCICSRVIDTPWTFSSEYSYRLTRSNEKLKFLKTFLQKNESSNETSDCVCETLCEFDLNNHVLQIQNYASQHATALYYKNDTFYLWDNLHSHPQPNTKKSGLPQGPAQIYILIL
jgi:hypothetical protein